MKLSSGFAMFLGSCMLLLSCGVASAAAPTITSAPMMLSGGLQVGSLITIYVAATDPQGLPLAIAYNYGDGTSDQLGKHIYSAAGVYLVTVTVADGVASATATLTLTIKNVANLWISRQTITVGDLGKQAWHAKLIYNADRTLANIFNPITDGFAASLGNIPRIEVRGVGSSTKFSGPKRRLVFRSAPGAIPPFSIILNQSKETITINQLSATATDKVPGVSRNMVLMGANSFFLDQALDANGTFTSNSGYRSTAFVVSSASVKVGKPGKDSAMFSLLLGDPAFAFPSASGAKNVRVRVFNVLNQVVLEKDLTSSVVSNAGILKSAAGRFNYNSNHGSMTFRLSKATLTGLPTSEEHVRVEVTIGDQTYTTHVTLFAAKAGVFSTNLPNKFFNFIPGRIVDTTAPAVLSTVPANLAKDVAHATPISATFGEAMAPLTINSTTFTLQNGTTAIPGTVAYAGNTATFTPASTLALHTTFIATVTTGATDLSGNALMSNYAWTFTTGGQTVNPTIAFDLVGAKTFGDADFLVHANSNSSGAMTYSIQSGPGTMADATHVHITGAGTIVVLASELADVNYNAGTQTLSVTVAAAGVSVAQSTVSASPSSVAADGVAISTVTVTLKDTNGTPVSGKTVTLAKTLGPGSPVVSAASGPSNASGVVTFTVKSTTVGADVFAATDVTDSNLVITQKATVTFTATAATAAQSTVSASPNSVVADGVAISTVTVTLKDTNGTAVSGKTVTLAKTSGPGSPVISAASGPSNASGVVTFTVKSTTAGTDVFSATDVTDSNLVISQTATVTFTATAATAAQSTVSANPLSVIADGVAISTITVTLKDVNGNAVSGKSVTLAQTSGPGAPVISAASGPSDALGVVTFTVKSNTVGADVFTATDVTDGNVVVNQTATVTFTTAPAALGAIAPFGTFGGGAGMTNQGLLSVVNGDIGTTGVSTTVTGFHDSTGDIYTETPLNAGQVNGRIFTDAPPPAHPGGLPVGGTAVTKAIADQAAADALIAFNKLSPAQTPGGTDPGAGHLGGLTLFPGVYKSASGTFDLIGSDLTLDGQGDPNAVWIFQMASSLTVGAPGFPRSIILKAGSGAQAKNVFWQVGAAATINAAGGGTMVGTIIASAGVTFSTAGNVTVVTLNGRAIGLNASTTLVNTVINVPAP